jgi:hypothetical protein
MATIEKERWCGWHEWRDKRKKNKKTPSQRIYGDDAKENI